MLRFILSGLCLLQFQVTYSSYVCRESKPTCFPTYNEISTNDIRDDCFLSKQPKAKILIFQPKSLHRFQPCFLKQHDICAPALFRNPQIPISTSIDPENKIADFCGIKSQETSQVNNAPNVCMEVEPPKPDPEETVYEEASKQFPSTVDTQDRISDDPLPEDDVDSSDTTSIDIEGQEGQSSLSPSDNIPFAQCSSTESPLNDEAPSLNPCSIISETDQGIGSQSDTYEPKLEECSEALEGSAEGGEKQLTEICGEPICTQQEIPQSIPSQSLPLDNACENVSSASAVETDDNSHSILNTESVSSTSTPFAKESFIGTATDLGQTSETHACSGINKEIAENPVSPAITNECTNILSNMITGLSSITANTSPSLVKPIYEEVIRHVPTVRNVVRHHLVETTHHVPIVERIVQHERQDIIRHIPVIQKFTRNVVECCKKNIPVVQHRTRTVEEPYIDHVTHTEKVTRPVIETLVKQVPVVFSRYKPVVHQRIRHVPTVETRFVPVVEASVTTIPVKQKVIKHVVEDRIRPIAGPWGGCTLGKTSEPSSNVYLGLEHLC